MLPWVLRDARRRGERYVIEDLRAQAAAAAKLLTKGAQEGRAALERAHRRVQQVSVVHTVPRGAQFFAHLASAAYARINKDTAKLRRATERALKAGYVLDTKLSDDRHLVFRGKRDSVVAFRGTAQRSDWLVDLRVVMEKHQKHQHFQNAVALVKRVMDEHGHARVKLCGHSLGGAAALHAAQELSSLQGQLSSLSAEAYAFNPAVSPLMAARWVRSVWGQQHTPPAVELRKRHSRLHVYLVKGDPVSSSLLLASTAQYDLHVLPPRPGLNAHALANFLPGGKT